MYPLQHTLSSAVVVLLYAIVSGVYGMELVLWVSAAAAFTLLLDGDHFIVLIARKDFRHMRMFLSDPLIVFREPAGFQRKIHFPGFGRLRLLTHAAITAATYLVLREYYPLLIAPVMVSLLTHIFFDILNYLENPQNR